MSLYLQDTTQPVTITYNITDVSKYKFLIDVTLNLTHNNSCEVTDFPIEDGSSISDHVINKPRTISLTGIVSDYKYQLFPISFPFSTDDKPSKKVYDIFQEIFQKKFLVEIDTGLEVYNNMIIESMSFPRSAETQEALEFTINLKELVFVNSELTEVPDEFYKEDVKSKATSKKKTTKQTTPVTQKPKTESGSTFYNLGAL